MWRFPIWLCSRGCSFNIYFIHFKNCKNRNVHLPRQPTKSQRVEDCQGVSWCSHGSSFLWVGLAFPRSGQGLGVLHSALVVLNNLVSAVSLHQMHKRGRRCLPHSCPCHFETVSCVRTGERAGSRTMWTGQHPSQTALCAGGRLPFSQKVLLLPAGGRFLE